MTDYGEMALRAAEAAQDAIKKQHQLNDEETQRRMNEVVREHDLTHRQIEAGFGGTPAPVSSPTTQEVSQEATPDQGQTSQQTPATTTQDTPQDAPDQGQTSHQTPAPAPDQAQEPTTQLVPPPPASEPTTRRHPADPRGWTALVLALAVFGGVIWALTLGLNGANYAIDQLDPSQPWRAFWGVFILVVGFLSGFFLVGWLGDKATNNDRKDGEAA